jgi:hypothetical protein
MEFIKAANLANPNLEDRAMIRNWHVGNYGAWAGVMALRRLSEERHVTRKHLNAAKKLFGDDRIDFGIFTGGSVRVYATNASTSSDAKFKAEMEKNMRAVWARVKMVDVFNQGRIPLSSWIEFDDGNRQHAAVFQDNRVFMASWPWQFNRKRESNSDGQLLINKVYFHPHAFTRVEMLPEVIGGSPSDAMLSAFRAVIVQEMMRALRERPRDMSIKTAFSDWVVHFQFGGTAALIRDNRNWSRSGSRYAGATTDNMWSEQLDEMREHLIRSHLNEFASESIYERAEILPRLKRLAVHAIDLAQRYSPLAGAVDYGYSGAAGEAVTADVNEVVAPGALEGGEVGGAEICDYANVGHCGGVYDVVPDEEPGITEADVAGNFSGRMRLIFPDLIQRISKAEAIEAADALAQNKELQKLHKELLHTIIAFQIHADGVRQQMEADNMLRGVSVQEDSYKKLVDISSDLALLNGYADYLGAGIPTAEEPYIAERKMRYNVAYEPAEIGGGRQVPVVMIRVKENCKKSKYVAFLLDVNRPW